MLVETSNQPPNATPTVFVVDDDAAVLQSVRFLLETVRLRVQCFSSAEALLGALRPDSVGCVLTDVRMAGMSGLELQERLARQGIPVIVLTGHGDVPMAVRALKAGAWDFMEKPVRDQQLIDTINRAINHHTRAAADKHYIDQLRQNADRLSPREREVFAMVVQGLANKQIAAALDLSEKTVEIHRAGVMRKMHADSLPALVRMAVLLEREQLASMTIPQRTAA